MMYSNGGHIIDTLKKRWINLVLLSYLLSSLASAILITGLLHFLWPVSLWYVLLLWVVFSLLILLFSKAWKIKETDIVIYLNKTFPQLEDSCDLLLKSPDNLSLLERLQAGKTESILQHIAPAYPLRKRNTSAFIFLLMACALFSVVLIAKPSGNSTTIKQRIKSGSSRTEKILPAISSAEITIFPPAYTGKHQRLQQQFNLLVEEGADVSWQIKTNTYFSKLELVLNDSMMVNMTAANKDHTLWKVNKRITSPGFYQVKAGETASELYRLDVIKDALPAIAIEKPLPYTTIDFGMPQKVNLLAHAADDYGIKEVSIYATVASGSGEAVKFKEQKMSFPVSFTANSTAYSLNRLIDLKAMDMQPGNELYFYLQATDTHNQQTRSDMYIVVLPDTAELMNADMVMNGINLKPEYFRSQRQIIIETEQLLKDKGAITIEGFNKKSNELASDQKLLRLRYGKFLGEESETSIGDARFDKDEHHSDEKEHDAADAKDFGNAEKVMDAYEHKHDNAEDATFFDPETKKQLKATLDEMWKAELQLRLYKPSEALPFEYKALRLLKDLQQKTRAYVGKTSVALTPLKPEKRLTGELDKIINPATEYTQPNVDVARSLPYAIAILENLKDDHFLLTNISTAILREAAGEISSKAASEPSKYLGALQAVRRILNTVALAGKITTEDILVCQQALQSMLAEINRLPSRQASLDGFNLSKQYFMNLKKAGKNSNDQ